MTCAWSGTVGELKQAVVENRYAELIQSGYEAFYQRPSEKEVKSWRESIRELFRAMPDTRFDNLQIIIEMQMPIGLERADVILLGGTQDARRAIIIELKQWSNVKLLNATREVIVPGIGIHQHPSIQVLNYRGKLKFFNAKAHNYDIKTAVFAHNLTLMDQSTLTSGIVPADWLREAPILIGSQTLVLAELIEDFLLPCQLATDEHIQFSQAEYKQSVQLFEFLRKNAQNIANNAAFLLANSGMGLTEEQATLQSEVIRALESGEKKDFVVQGNPGSGKTLLAISLLLQAAKQNKSCLFAMRNNRLMAILRQILDSTYPGLAGMMLFFNLQRGGICLKNHIGGLDLLLCDEAQRIDQSTLAVVPEKARVSVIFLDEKQRLNPPERGTIGNFQAAAQQVGKASEVRYLSAPARIHGGERYMAWLERLLHEPGKHAEHRLADQEWTRLYRFHVSDSVEEMTTRLEEMRMKNNRVAMVASFTESPGVIDNPKHPDNLRVGYPLTSGYNLYQNSKVNIPWLMSPREYTQFWLDGRSNKLQDVASIYGAQGFESDYVGVIWGRDFLYRDGKWILGDPQHCYDAIDRLINKSRGSHTWNAEAFELMINRYRIFLTRGIKGTLVFCEDTDTRNYLRALQEGSYS